MAPLASTVHWFQDEAYYESIAKRKEEIAQKSRELLDKYRVFFQEKGIDVSTEFISGDPQGEICKFSHEKKADMIIIGSRGMTGIKRALIGSVANHVVQCINDIPVLVVK